MDWKICGVMPTLDSDNLLEAIDYYSQFGFTEMWRWPDPAPHDYEDGIVPEDKQNWTHAGIKFGDAVSIMLVQFKAEWGSIQRQNLYFFVENVDELYNQVKQFHQGRIEGVKDYDYVMRDFSINDPWGHELTFGQNLK